MTDEKICVPKCPEYYFQDNDHNVCKRCPDNCKNCDSENCTQCDTENGY